jgi:hypothetical protein
MICFLLQVAHFLESTPSPWATALCTMLHPAHGQAISNSYGMWQQAHLLPHAAAARAAAARQYSCCASLISPTSCNDDRTRPKSMPSYCLQQRTRCAPRVEWPCFGRHVLVDLFCHMAERDTIA